MWDGSAISSPTCPSLSPDPVASRSPDFEAGQNSVETHGWISTPVHRGWISLGAAPILASTSL